jgi:hypothetical protein
MDELWSLDRQLMQKKGVLLLPDFSVLVVLVRDLELVQGEELVSVLVSVLVVELVLVLGVEWVLVLDVDRVFGLDLYFDRFDLGCLQRPCSL